MKLTEHATGFSQWLMTKFSMSAEFIRRKIGWHGSCRTEFCDRTGA